MTQQTFSLHQHDTIRQTWPAVGEMGFCRGAHCHRPVLWVRTVAGVAQPLDPEPVDDGTVYFSHDGLARTIAKLERAGVLWIGPRYRPHHQSCPDALQYTRPSRRPRRHQEEAP